MKRSPSELVKTPPSPRTDSVTKIPRTDGGQTIPVGWNCKNSMSTRFAPAFNASACPSPVPSQEFDVILKVFPTPPVAIITVGASNKTSAPVSRQYPYAPETLPFSFRISVIVNSAKTLMLLSIEPYCSPSFCCNATIFCCIVRISSRPVRSPTCARRGYSCPPKLRCEIFPSLVRSNRAPHVSSSQMRSGASFA
ncbi:unannotated protein [freshwater metagenome]|uniref:Unannotated protein n=1 Tax=freshwater metagenome TaxID=449393 RepID=A0A6J7XR96_9ZZZZ